VSLIGHDWGGYVSFMLALGHAERVDRLVALDIPPPWTERPRRSHLGLPVFLSYQFLLATPGLGAMTMRSSNRFVRSIIRAGSGRRKHWSEQELDAYANVLRDPARAAASSACYRTFLTRELPSGLRNGYRPRDLNVPTLLLMGGSSALQRVLQPQPRANLRIEVIDGAGHFLPEEAPDEVLELATEHLRKTTPSG
jgi:pimeloyl-ACP methyl ester carboxylesterase